MSDERRQSIAPTYDHRETGDRFTVETRVRSKVISRTPLRDPFMRHRIVVGWRDLVAALLRGRLEVVVTLDADGALIEDICELDADYAGRFGSTRRDEWREEIQSALSSFARSGDGE